MAIGSEEEIKWGNVAVNWAVSWGWLEKTFMRRRPLSKTQE